METSEAQKRKQKAEVTEFVLAETLQPNGTVSNYLVKKVSSKTMFSQAGDIQVNKSTVCSCCPPTSVHLFACVCVYV